jgi:hypothetical protein
MLDVSATGCALQADRQVPPGTRLSIAVRREAPVAPLSVEAEVVWCRGPRLAVAFTRVHGGVDLRRWIDALGRADSAVRGAADRIPAQVPTDARLTVRRDVALGAALAADEAALVQAAWNGCAVGLAALHARLPPDRFARALYALLGKGIVTCPAAEASLDLGERALADLARQFLPRDPPAAAPARDSSGRGALRSDRLAADLALGVKGR